MVYWQRDNRVQTSIQRLLTGFWILKNYKVKKEKKKETYARMNNSKLDALKKKSFIFKACVT